MTRRILYGAASVALVCVFSSVGHPVLRGQGRPAAPPASVVAIRGATILTITHGTIPTAQSCCATGRLPRSGRTFRFQPAPRSLLKEKGIPVILGPVLTLPSREDMSHAATYQAAGELVRAGVKIAFTAGGVGDSASVRQLPYNAAESVAWGLPRDEAVKALTINAAEILGVADQIGSLEPHKMANLVIAKGDPLEVRTEVTRVIINGRGVGLMNKQLALYQRYMARP